MKYKSLLLIPLVIMLAGCASDSKKFVDLNLNYLPSNSAPAQSDATAQAQIAQAADSVNSSLQQLSAVEKASHPRAKIAPPKDAKAIGMAQVVSLNWNGPVQPLVKQIASASHYRVSVIGKKPAVPVIVTLNAKNQTLAEILRNVTFQVQAHANISVYPAKRLIELSYYNS